jgi:hypothetical protein
MISTLAGLDDWARCLHERALVIDTLAGGPGVYTTRVLTELDTIAAIESTADMLREIERLQHHGFPLACDRSVRCGRFKPNLLDLGGG